MEAYNLLRCNNLNGIHSIVYCISIIQDMKELYTSSFYSFPAQLSLLLAFHSVSNLYLHAAAGSIPNS